MKIVAYIRVSTAEQAESGLGLADQRAKIEAYATLYDHEIVEWCEDGGFSASSLDRPGLSRALELVEDGAADAVCVAKLDRLTRTVADLGSLLAGPLRGALVSVGEQIDTSSAAGRMVLHILATVAQWEREALGERTSAALQAKRARGERVGHVRFGYRLSADGVTEVEDETEQACIARARALHEAGTSLRKIARALSAEGFAPRKGGEFAPTQVKRMLG